MSALTKVTIIGASGNVGAIILRSLLQDSSLNVSVLTRESGKGTFPSGAKVIRTDFTEASLVKVFTGQDAVISVVGASALGDQKTYIDAAVKAGVNRFLPSEFGIDTFTKASQELVPIMPIKIGVFEYLKSKESEGLTWTALFPGLLFDWGLRAGFLGFDIASRKATIWDRGSTRFSMTNEADLGRAVLSILHKPDETTNKVLYLRTVTTTQKEILDAFEKQSGAEWSKEYVETEKQIEIGRKLLGEGNFDGAFLLVQAAGYGDAPGVLQDLEEEPRLANELLEVPLGSVKESVEAVLRG